MRCIETPQISLVCEGIQVQGKRSRSLGQRQAVVEADAGQVHLAPSLGEEWSHLGVCTSSLSLRLNSHSHRKRSSGWAATANVPRALLSADKSGHWGVGVGAHKVGGSGEAGSRTPNTCSTGGHCCLQDGQTRQRLQSTAPGCHLCSHSPACSGQACSHPHNSGAHRKVSHAGDLLSHWAACEDRLPLLLLTLLLWLAGMAYAPVPWQKPVPSGELQVPLCLGPSKWDMLSALCAILSKPARGPGVSSGTSRAWCCHHLGQLGAGGSFLLSLPSPLPLYLPPPPCADFGITVLALGPGSRKACKVSEYTVVAHSSAGPAHVTQTTCWAAWGHGLGTGPGVLLCSSAPRPSAGTPHLCGRFPASWRSPGFTGCAACSRSLRLPRAAPPKEAWVVTSPPPPRHTFLSSEGRLVTHLPRRQRPG